MVELCEGCENRIAIGSCRRYALPDRQHTRIGGCGMDTRKLKDELKDVFKLNPIKASKRQVKQ